MVDDPPRRTLAARLEDRDRGRFAGRHPELSFLDRCLDDDSQFSVVHVCGPGGIGKSALLRETARRARDRGIDVISIDGRELGPAPGTLDLALGDAADCSRPLLLLDSYEKMIALDGYLRRELLPTLPDQALVVIAGRAAPDPAWFAGGWESVTTRLDLTGLASPDAQALLAARGISDERVPAIIDWAAGSPLALALAADAASDATWHPARETARPEIFRSLVHRLVESELRDLRLPALGIAAVARTTTPQLLRAVLPHADAESAYHQLCDLTVTEPLGDGITLHELVRKALRADLRLRNSELERDMRRRIVDYLYELAIEGQQLMMIDMAHLVENSQMRWGFGWEGNVGFRIDSIRADDADRVARLLRDDQNSKWWQLTRRFFVESPDRVAVARDLDDRICGYMAAMSPANAPRFADTDPLIGPWLAHARRHAAEGESVLWHAAVDFTRQGKVQAMLGMAGVLRSGTTNPRFAYLPIDPAYPGALEFASVLGATHLAELDNDIGGQMVECHRLDNGPGGLMASLRDQVYSELGLPLPPRPAPGPVQPREPTRRAHVEADGGADAETVREALRSFGVPRDLARSPLARGTTVPERGEYVRRLLLQAAGDAFGDSENERLLYNVLKAGYLEPARSHEAAAARLCLSRAAYFRRLRTAVERLAEQVAHGRS